MLSIQDKIVFLKKTELFSGIPEDTLVQAAEALEEVRYDQDDVIMREGEAGDTLYLIVEGNVKILKENIHVLTLKQGACIGEMAILDNEPRSATIIAGSEVQALCLTRTAFQRVLSGNTAMIEGIFHLLTDKLRYDLDVHLESVRTQEQINQDIRRARQIQQAMLPQEDLAHGWLTITGYCNPAASVGGDYYDYIPISDDAVGVFIGDVTGHGFYSGLIVSIAKSCIVTQLQTDPSVESVLTAINRVVEPSGPDWMFMTACYALLDRITGKMVYANAGHNPPFYYDSQSGELKELDPTDVPLGIFKEATCNPVEMAWQPGDTLIFYSDGVVEAENDGGDLFGEEALEHCIKNSIHLSAVEIKEAILKEVEAFTQGVPQQDDITLVVARL